MASSLGTNAVVVTRVHCRFNIKTTPLIRPLSGRTRGGHNGILLYIIQNVGTCTLYNKNKCNETLVHFITLLIKMYLERMQLHVHRLLKFTFVLLSHFPRIVFISMEWMGIAGSTLSGQAAPLHCIQLFLACLWNSQKYCPRCRGQLDGLLPEAGSRGQ